MSVFTFPWDMAKKAYRAISRHPYFNEDELEEGDTPPWPGRVTGAIGGFFAFAAVLAGYAVISPLLLYLVLPAKMDTTFGPPAGLVTSVAAGALSSLIFPPLLPFWAMVSLPPIIYGTTSFAVSKYAPPELAAAILDPLLGESTPADDKKPRERAKTIEEQDPSYERDHARGAPPPSLEAQDAAKQLRLRPSPADRGHHLPHGSSSSGLFDGHRRPSVSHDDHTASEVELETKRKGSDP